MKLKIVAVALILITATSGCAHDPHRKENIGAVSGAAAGGLLGAQIGSGPVAVLAAGAGVLIGALIGSSIGRDLDELDRMKAEEAAERAHVVPIGETVTWNNPESQNYGSVTPTRDGTSSKGEYCREYQKIITIDGETQEAYGVACLQPNGDWRMVD